MKICYCDLCKDEIDGKPHTVTLLKPVERDCGGGK